MDIQSLKTFITLAETKSYTKTANQLFVAQSTVTNRINELERELKLSLFSRTNRSAAPEPPSRGKRACSRLRICSFCRRATVPIPGPLR